jgi:hypothetical protein
MKGKQDEDDNNLKHANKDKNNDKTKLTNNHNG